MIYSNKAEKVCFNTINVHSKAGQKSQKKKKECWYWWIFVLNITVCVKFYISAIYFFVHT